MENPANFSPEVSPDSVSPLPPSGFFARYGKILWGGLIVLALLTAGLVIYILFFRSHSTGPSLTGQIKVTIDAPEQSASGSELPYKITIENNTNENVTGVSLELFYPIGFTFLDSKPDAQDPSGRAFSLADLAAGQQQELTIVGTLEGSVQEIKTLNVKLHYSPVNLRSAQVLDASASTSIVAPDLSLNLDAPPQLTSGQTITYKIQVSNLASRPFANVLLRFNFPEKFQFVSAADPQPSQKTDQKSEWQLSQLAVGEARTFSISGKILADPGTESSANLEVFTQDQNGNLLSAGRQFAITQILPSPLRLSQTISNLQGPVVAGQTLTYEIDYENTGDTGLNNVVISLVFDTNAFDFSKLKGSKGQLQGNALVWIPAQVPELLVVSPHQKGTFRVDLGVSSALVANLQKNPSLKTHLQYVTKELTEPILGNTIEIKVQTQTAVSVSGRIVSGQTPPVVGQATTYEIDLVVTNGVNDLDNAVLAATIPRVEAQIATDSIAPPDEKDNVQFVPVAGTLRWQLDKLFAFTGSFYDARRLSFQLTIIPTSSDRLNDLTLLNNIQVSGTDEFTGNPVTSNTINALSTAQIH